MVTRHLLLSLGDKKCRLTVSELQRYPDTLFAKIASGIGSTCAPELEGSGTGTTGSSDEGTIVVSLDKLEGSPFTEWPHALSVVAALYRDYCIPTHLLEKLLGHEMAAADNNKDNGKVHLIVHSSLKSLLEFIGFDGPVSRWMPITRMDFFNPGAMQVTYACIASEAAQLIMSHKPHADASANFQWVDMAAFLVTTDRNKTSLDVCLVKIFTDGVRTVVKATHEADQKISTAWETTLVATSSSISGNNRVWVQVGATEVQPLPVANTKQAYLAGESATSLASTAIGPCRVAGQKYPEYIGRYFAQAREALKPPELNIAACSVPLYSTNGSLHSEMLPLWVVYW